MIKDIDIHKCLVCKGEYVEIDNYNDKYQVVCKLCKTSTSKSYDIDILAITAWNLMCMYYNKEIK